MWELIRINKHKSIVLMVLMATVLVLLGLIIGYGIMGPQGGLFGILVAVSVTIILMLISFSAGDQLLLTASKATPVTKKVHPQLFNIVEEMKIASGLPAMPKIYIINDPAPNAFATGRNPEKASVAVTAGLLGRLNRDELQGVIAHEISHILHRDILFVTLAGIMLGSIVLLSQVFLRGMLYSSMGSSRRYSSGGKSGAQGAAVLLIIALIAAILAPIFAQLLYFALSRKREYLADAGAARLTRYPEGLASALEKISNDPAPQLSTVNKVTAPMYIVNPFKKKGQMKLSDLTSTHPPISERIKILRNMMHGASFKQYSESYSQTTGEKTPIIPKTALSEEEIQLREASAEAKGKHRLGEQLHQVGDIMRKVNGFIFLGCMCGLTLKIPPNFKSEKVKCPRCKRILNIDKKKQNQS